MTEGPTIERVSNPSATNTHGDIVFLHGLGGHLWMTWTPDSPDAVPLPTRLAAKMPDLTVWTLGYPASPSAWLGGAMDMNERARNLLAHVSQQLGTRPIVFVAHSLGGLILKRMLLECHLASRQEPNWTRLLRSTAGVVFLSTPHFGSDYARLARLLRVIARPTNLTTDLSSSIRSLDQLNHEYRLNHASYPRGHRVYYETQPLRFGPFRLRKVIVDRRSADPGLPQAEPIALDGTHLSICKPSSDDCTLCRDLPNAINRFLGEYFARPPAACLTPTGRMLLVLEFDQTLAAHDAESLRQLVATALSRANLDVPFRIHSVTSGSIRIGFELDKEPAQRMLLLARLGALDVPTLRSVELRGMDSEGPLDTILGAVSMEGPQGGASMLWKLPENQPRKIGDTVCYMGRILGFEKEKAEAEKYVGESTHDYREVRVYVTLQRGWIYAHSNYKPVTSAHVVKMATSSPRHRGLWRITQNLLGGRAAALLKVDEFEALPADLRRAIEDAHRNQIRYVVNALLLGPNGRIALDTDDATRVVFLDS